jgi:hypothetical protein
MRFLAAVLLLLAMPASAATIVLDFEEEALGGHGESFVSAEWDDLTLSLWTGVAELTISERAGHGRVLWVGHEGGSLLLSFAVPVASVTLEFGDSGAALRAWDPPVLVGITTDGMAAADSTVPTMNGLIDEQLMVTWPRDEPFRSALFQFVQFGEHAPESPVIGRIILETLEVPEPAVFGLLALAGSVAAARNRRRP